nr:MAG TPA: hypothetical protein [Caudoviricetes sp.]
MSRTAPAPTGAAYIHPKMYIHIASYIVSSSRQFNNQNMHSVC